MVDNNSGSAERGALRQLSSEHGVHLIFNSENLGIGAALNQGVCWAAEEGYTWVLTLDQDSVVANDMVSTLASVYEELPEKENLAIIGSNYRDSNGGKLFISADRGDQRSWQEVKTVITSGSLVSLAAYSALGPFREEFFMDCVDLEYCLRARSHGFRIIVTRKPLMDHALGATTMHRLLWKRTGTSNHLPVRRYYMARNHVVLMREYIFREPLWVLRMVYSLLKSGILFLLFEQNRILKLKCSAMGLFDGLASNCGRRLS
ncbi:MAG TPA: glycosyltransferase family 2 protein [Candidatus Sulfotelmatobacter sp.]|nr:glycosyltransferase family 2 protein [Candidatus Sulfotelmatobacter sp.]